MAVLKYRTSGGTFEPLGAGATGITPGTVIGETLMWDGTAWVPKDIIWTGTQAAYDAEVTSGIDPQVLYIIQG